MYYRPEYTFDEMNHVNFDWFRPLNCHRQTPEQVEKWVKDSGMEIEHIDVEEAGITVVAKKLI
jgi:arsenite methyltransferase